MSVLWIVSLNPEVEYLNFSCFKSGIVSYSRGELEGDVAPKSFVGETRRVSIKKSIKLFFPFLTIINFSQMSTVHFMICKVHSILY